MTKYRTKLTKQIHSLRKASEWGRVDPVRIAEVWPRRKIELDRPFDDRINDGQDYLSRLDGLLKKEEGENFVEWIPIEVLGQLFVLIGIGSVSGLKSFLALVDWQGLGEGDRDILSMREKSSGFGFRKGEFTGFGFDITAWCVSCILSILS
jgi:hypothetical protein